MSKKSPWIHNPHFFGVVHIWLLFCFTGLIQQDLKKKQYGVSQSVFVYNGKPMCIRLSGTCPLPPGLSSFQQMGNMKDSANISVTRETYKRATAAASRPDLRGRVAAEGACVLAAKEPTMPPPSPQRSPYLLCNCL